MQRTCVLQEEGGGGGEEVVGGRASFTAESTPVLPFRSHLRCAPVERSRGRSPMPAWEEARAALLDGLTGQLRRRFRWPMFLPRRENVIPIYDARRWPGSSEKPL